MFTPWKCGDCGAHGKIRHDRADNAARIARWTSEEHARKSPACHQKAAAAQDVLARLKPRDRHILITARIKRRLMADALRLQRAADREAAASIPDESTARDRRGKTRRDWMLGRASRKGYCIT